MKSETCGMDQYLSIGVVVRCFCRFWRLYKLFFTEEKTFTQHFYTPKERRVPELRKDSIIEWSVSTVKHRFSHHLASRYLQSRCHVRARYGDCFARILSWKVTFVLQETFQVLLCFTQWVSCNTEPFTTLLNSKLRKPVHPTCFRLNVQICLILLPS